MRRKIISQKSAYCVTLPIKWIRDRNLKGSDEIEIKAQGDDLLVSSEKKSIESKKEIILDESTDHYYRIIIENMYLRGIDTLNINFPNTHAFEVIQEVTANLIGYEIISNTKSVCIINQTAAPTDKQVLKLVNRLLQIIGYAQNILIEDLQKKQLPHMQLQQKTIEDIRRFNLFIRRAVHKLGIIPMEEETFLDLLMERLAITGYETYFCYQKLSRIKKIIIRKEVLNLHKDATLIYKQFQKMLHRQDLREFASINKNWEKLYFEKVHKLQVKANYSEQIVLYHAANLANIVFLVAQPNAVGSINPLLQKKD